MSVDAHEMRRDRVQQMLKGSRELRVVQSVPELRRESGGALGLRGHASRFTNWYDIGDPEKGGFRERIMPGAFKRTLSESPDGVLLLGHGEAGSGLPLARTTAGNLALHEDDLGLAVDASPLDPDDPDVALLAAKMRSGLITGMSFAFRCTADSWSSDRTERTITNVTLQRGDVSVVVHGANDLASAEMVARSVALASSARRPPVGSGQRLRERRILMRRREAARGGMLTPESEADLSAVYRRRLEELRGRAA